MASPWAVVGRAAGHGPWAEQKTRASSLVCYGAITSARDDDPGTTTAGPSLCPWAEARQWQQAAVEGSDSLSMVPAEQPLDGDLAAGVKPSATSGSNMALEGASLGVVDSAQVPRLVPRPFSSAAI